MIDRHAVQALLTAGHPTTQIAQQFGVSPWTVQRIGQEPPVVDGADGAARQGRGIGRPGVAAAVRQRLQRLIEADPRPRRWSICGGCGTRVWRWGKAPSTGFTARYERSCRRR